MRYLLFILVCFINVTAFCQPVASFTLSRQKVCSGKAVVFNNTSTGAGSFAWYVNNVFYSNNIHDSITIIEPCYDLVPVMLIANGTTGADTQTHFFEVMDTCFMHLTGDYTNCVGDTIRRKAHLESIANIWSINPPHTILDGCLTCDSVVFILAVQGTTVDLQSTYDGGCMQEVTYHYGVCNPITNAGVSNITADKIKIYPNPVDGHINIENETGERINSISIYDVTGILVKQHKNEVKQISGLESLTPGIYFLKLEFQNAVSVKKIIKQ